MKLLIQIMVLIVFVFAIQWVIKEYNLCGCPYKNTEEFQGALQSLYSNDGIQDTYLTINNDRGYYDPYAYWRGVTWNLPTRNLDRIIFYPYLYEYYIDRYARLYPYW